MTTLIFILGSVVVVSCLYMFVALLQEALDWERDDE